MAEPAARTELADIDVRRRIGSSGISETLFVEAGAGSGKTKVLVDRIVNLIVDHGVDPHELAAITFTEAAASELRDRIRAGLECVVLDGGAGAARCRAALADLDRSTISTLHGFALRILTEHAVAARLPPKVAVLDEVASQLQQERRWAHHGLCRTSERDAGQRVEAGLTALLPKFTSVD